MSSDASTPSVPVVSALEGSITGVFVMLITSIDAVSFETTTSQLPPSEIIARNFSASALLLKSAMCIMNPSGLEKSIPFIVS